MAEAVLDRFLPTVRIFSCVPRRGRVRWCHAVLETIETLDRMGIEHDGLSRALTADMIKNATLVLGMTNSRKAARALVEEDQNSRTAFCLSTRTVSCLIRSAWDSQPTTGSANVWLSSFPSGSTA